MKNRLLVRRFARQHKFRRGFTIFFTFFCVLIIISAVLFSHSFELENVASAQKRLLNRKGYIRPAVDPRLNSLLIEALDNK